MLLSVTNRRSAPRRSRIDDDIRSYDCHVHDVSEGGAKLSADVEAPIGSTLYLSTVPHALARKRCEVIWRKKQMIGVQFV